MGVRVLKMPPRTRYCFRRLSGKPVRVQWMREDMTAWGSKGPAVLCDLAAGLDAEGEVSAVQFTSRAFSGGETHFRPDAMGNYLGAQLTGIPNTTGVDEFAQWGVQAPPYNIRKHSCDGPRHSRAL